jgi:hypothetical protein
VEDRENLKRLASGFINDEVGENPIEKYLPIRKVGAAMAAVRHIGELVETFEEFSDDSFRSLQAFLIQKVKPNGVDVEDGIFGELK